MQNYIIVGAKGSGKSYRSKHLIREHKEPVWIVDPLNEYGDISPKTVNKFGDYTVIHNRLKHLSYNISHRTTTLDPREIYYFCHEAYLRGKTIVIDEFHSVVEALKEKPEWHKKFDHDFRTARHKKTYYIICSQRLVGSHGASMTLYCEEADCFLIFRGQGRSWKNGLADYAGLNQEEIEQTRSLKRGHGFKIEHGHISKLEPI